MDIFSYADLDATAFLFKTLSEPVRLRIINLLTRGERCVCELTAVLGLPQSTVSRHLARLAKAGLVRGRRAGRWMHYRLPDTPNTDAAATLALCRNLLAEHAWAGEDLRALARYLDTAPPDRCC